MWRLEWKLTEEESGLTFLVAVLANTAGRHSWFDRDLTVGGRVITKSSDGELRHRLVHVEK